MAVMRERPYASSRFLVNLGAGDSRTASAGFCEVVLPAMQVPEGDPFVVPEYLVLRRGFVGALDLHAWFGKASRGKAPKRRTVRIELLDDDGERVVATWRFRNVRPVSLSYSPLRAMEPAVLIETVELAFDRVELL